MNDFLNFIQENWSSIANVCMGVVNGVAAIVLVIKSKSFSLYLKKAKQRETYTVCPHCKKEIPLSELSFHLPSGELDNNLNGVPDSSEI